MWIVYIIYRNVIDVESFFSIHHQCQLQHPQSRGQPPHNPSPGQPDPLWPQRTHPPPCPLQHTYTENLLEGRKTNSLKWQCHEIFFAFSPLNPSSWVPDKKFCWKIRFRGYFHFLLTKNLTRLNVKSNASPLKSCQKTLGFVEIVHK